MKATLKRLWVWRLVYAGEYGATEDGYQCVRPITVDAHEEREWDERVERGSRYFLLSFDDSDIDEDQPTPTQKV